MKIQCCSHHSNIFTSSVDRRTITEHRLSIEVPCDYDSPRHSADTYFQPGKVVSHSLGTHPEFYITAVQPNHTDSYLHKTVIYVPNCIKCYTIPVATAAKPLLSLKPRGESHLPAEHQWTSPRFACLGGRGWHGSDSGLFAESSPTQPLHHLPFALS